MIPSGVSEPTTGARPRRLLAALATSTAAHAFLGLMMFFDVLGVGGGFGLGIGPGFGIGEGGGLGLGEKRRREIFSSVVLPRWVQRCGGDCARLWADTLGPATGVQTPAH